MEKEETIEEEFIDYFRNIKEGQKQVLSIRIDPLIYYQIKEYEKNNLEFNKVQIVEDAFRNQFSDGNYLKINILETKKKLDEYKEQLKQMMERKKKLKLREKKIKRRKEDEFKDDLNNIEQKYWVETIEILNDKPDLFKGRFRYYKNQINKNITKEDFKQKLKHAEKIYGTENK